MATGIRTPVSHPDTADNPILGVLFSTGFAGVFALVTQLAVREARPGISTVAICWTVFSVAFAVRELGVAYPRLGDVFTQTRLYRWLTDSIEECAGCGSRVDTYRGRSDRDDNVIYHYQMGRTNRRQVYCTDCTTITVTPPACEGDTAESEVSF
jgi:hypothetical protein